MGGADRWGDSRGMCAWQVDHGKVDAGRGQCRQGRFKMGGIRTDDLRGNLCAIDTFEEIGGIGGVGASFAPLRGGALPVQLQDHSAAPFPGGFCGEVDRDSGFRHSAFLLGERYDLH